MISVFSLETKKENKLDISFVIPVEIIIFVENINISSGQGVTPYRRRKSATLLFRRLNRWKSGTDGIVRMIEGIKIKVDLSLYRLI